MTIEKYQICFVYVSKRKEDFLRREFDNRKKKKKSDLFCFEEKLRSASNEDTDLFCFDEKFRSKSKEDASPFYCEEKFRFASKEDVICFILKKNSDLHLKKM